MRAGQASCGFQGEVSVPGAPAERSSHQIGYAPQCLAVDLTLPVTTLGGDLDAARRGRGRALDEAFWHLVETPGLQALFDEPRGTRSGGQFKRGLVARATMGDPRLLSWTRGGWD